MSRPRTVPPAMPVPADDYVARRLAEGGLRLVSGSPTMLSDEFARYVADRTTAPTPPDVEITSR